MRAAADEIRKVAPVRASAYMVCTSLRAPKHQLLRGVNEHVEECVAHGKSLQEHSLIPLATNRIFSETKRPLDLYSQGKLPLSRPPPPFLCHHAPSSEKKPLSQCLYLQHRQQRTLCGSWLPRMLRGMEARKTHAEKLHRLGKRSYSRNCCLFLLDVLFGRDEKAANRANRPHSCRFRLSAPSEPSPGKIVSHFARWVADAKTCITPSGSLNMFADEICEAQELF
eukprot:6470604-Amphidinium_carterae.2